MNEALYDLTSEAFTFGLCLLVLILVGIKAYERLHLLKYNKETKRFERQEREERERFGRNVKPINN